MAARGFAAWPVEMRLAAKIDVTESGCWTWLGARQSAGYGLVHFNGVQTGAHRVAYEIARGKIPEGLVLDHLCRNPSCVNPDHLEPVTQRENLMRGDTIPAAHARKTHCPNGHPYSGDNLGVAKRGSRFCRICHAATDLKSKIKRSKSSC